MLHMPTPTEQVEQQDICIPTTRLALLRPLTHRTATGHKCHLAPGRARARSYDLISTAAFPHNAAFCLLRPLLDHDDSLMHNTQTQTMRWSCGTQAAPDIFCGHSVHPKEGVEDRSCLQAKRWGKGPSWYQYSRPRFGGRGELRMWDKRPVGIQTLGRWQDPTDLQVSVCLQSRFVVRKPRCIGSCKVIQQRARGCKALGSV